MVPARGYFDARRRRRHLRGPVRGLRATAGAGAGLAARRTADRPPTSSTRPRASRRTRCSPRRPAHLALRHLGRRHRTPGARRRPICGRRASRKDRARMFRSVDAHRAARRAPAAASAQAPPGPPGPPPGNGTDLPAPPGTAPRVRRRPARRRRSRRRGRAGPAASDDGRAQPREAHVLGPVRVPGQRHAPRHGQAVAPGTLARASYRCVPAAARRRGSRCPRRSRRSVDQARVTVAATATIRQGARTAAASRSR